MVTVCIKKLIVFLNRRDILALFIISFKKFINTFYVDWKIFSNTKDFVCFPCYFPLKIFSCFQIFHFYLDALASIGSKKTSKIWFPEQNFTLHVIPQSEKLVKFTNSNCHTQNLIWKYEISENLNCDWSYKVSNTIFQQIFRIFLGI